MSFLGCSLPLILSPAVILTDLSFIQTPHSVRLLIFFTSVSSDKNIWFTSGVPSHSLTCTLWSSEIALLPKSLIKFPNLVSLLLLVYTSLFSQLPYFHIRSSTINRHLIFLNLLLHFLCFSSSSTLKFWFYIEYSLLAIFWIVSWLQEDSKMIVEYI